MSKKKKTGRFRRDFESAERKEYDYHLPVMLNETLDLLITDIDGIYIDGTLGGGGHTQAILERLGRLGNLYSFDKDTVAIDHCRKKFADELGSEKPRLKLVNASFGEAGSIKELRGGTKGFLLD